MMDIEVGDTNTTPAKVPEEPTGKVISLNRKQRRRQDQLLRKRDLKKPPPTVTEIWTRPEFKLIVDDLRILFSFVGQLTNTLIEKGVVTIDDLNAKPNEPTQEVAE
jgi:hypothetical protein